MPSASYQPAEIFVDRTVAALPYTQRILSKFPQVPVQTVEEIKLLKKPREMGSAKKTLLLAPMKADPLKEFRAMTQSSERPYFSLNLISNCHLECTYCILQSYLANNPAITIFANLEAILEKLEKGLPSLAPMSVVGTGKIADSLALDEITEHAPLLVDLFARQQRVLLEFKTKSEKVDALLKLDHRGRTVVSWSINPPSLIEREEYKTASFEERAAAARQVAEAGYKVGFHFDPLIIHRGWKRNYKEVVERIFDVLKPSQIAWISLGALRFPFRQKRIIQKRFPKNESLLQGLTSSHQTFLHYPKTLKSELLGFLENELLKFLKREQIYRCMDF